MKRKVLFTLMAAGLVAAALGAGAFAARPGDDEGAPQRTAGGEGVSSTGIEEQAKGSPGGTLSDNSGVVPAGTPAARVPATGAPAGGSSAYDAGGVAGGGAIPQAAGLDRKIVFSGNVNLEVDDVPRAFNDASRVARENGGFVERSTFAAVRQGDDGSQGSASLTIRVPADRYEDARAALRAIPGASVTGEGSKATEVTEQYTDLQSRLRNLERTEGQYLTLLEQAKTVTDILAVNDRLDGVRTQIEQVQGRINLLDNVTEYAAIDISLVPAAAGKPSDGDGPRGFVHAFSEAWEQSLEALRYAAAGAGVIAVIAIWLVIPVAVLYIAARALRRRHGPALPS